MKKRVMKILFLLTLFLAISLIIAEEQATVDPIEPSYACLKEKLGSNCGEPQNVEDTSFSLLAMAYDSKIQSDCIKALKDKKTDAGCWLGPGGTVCDIKSTALAVLALNYVGEDVTKSIDWLLTNRKNAEGLVWYLEIDANNPATCDISVDAKTGTFTIGADKKITGSIANCLTSDNYFLKINDACINGNFSISCSENFITTLLYKTPNNINHVSSETHSAEAGQITEEKVTSYCFGNPCGYEGSLWAALAISKTKKGADASSYIPYLSSKADENGKYLPFSFLYMITNIDDYYSKLLEKQKVIATKAEGYWKESTNEFYDTSLALLALQNMNLEEVNKAKKYLLGKREESGCWKSDNAFILYAGWPKSITTKTSTGTTATYCEEGGFYCTSPLECSVDNTADLFCTALSDVCCKTKPPEEPCAKQSGFICDATQQCTGNIVTASDTNYCCIGACQTISTENECEDASYTCKTFCSEEEEEKVGYSCNDESVCCAAKPQKPTNWLLIILLIVLIILVVLAIIFRDQLKVWWFKIKSKFTKGAGPAPTKRPPMPPSPFGFGRPMPPRRPMPSRPPAQSGAFRETMDKLKKMSQ